MSTSAIDILLRFVHILSLKKRMILLITLLPTLVCLVLMIFAKNTYLAEALIKPPVSESSSPLESVLKESSGGLLGALGSGTQTGENDCISILKSVQFEKLVVEKFDLETVYKFKDKKKNDKYYLADVLKQFNRRFGSEVTDEDAIRISMQDESSERAKEMVSFIIHTLDSLYTDVQRTATRRRLEYIDQRLALSESEMKSAEDSLVSFQNKHNLIVPDVQVRLILEGATQTEMQIEKLKEEMAVEAALRGTSSAKYSDLAVQKSLLLQTLKDKLRSHADSNSLMLPAQTLPALANEYFRLERAYSIRLAVYKYLVQQVESLKLDANKNAQVISVLDPPWNNDKRIAPKKRIMVESVFILSFILASVFSVLQSRWKKHQEENPESRALVLDMKKNLFKF